jgi:hypothetical protein
MSNPSVLNLVLSKSGLSAMSQDNKVLDQVLLQVDHLTLSALNTKSLLELEKYEEEKDLPIFCLDFHMYVNLGGYIFEVTLKESIVLVNLDMKVQFLIKSSERKFVVGNVLYGTPFECLGSLDLIRKYNTLSPHCEKNQLLAGVDVYASDVHFDPRQGSVDIFPITIESDIRFDYLKSPTIRSAPILCSELLKHKTAKDQTLKAIEELSGLCQITTKHFYSKSVSVDLSRKLASVRWLILQLRTLADIKPTGIDWTTYVVAVPAEEKVVQVLSYLGFMISRLSESLSKPIGLDTINSLPSRLTTLEEYVGVLECSVESRIVFDSRLKVFKKIQQYVDSLGKSFKFVPPINYQKEVFNKELSSEKAFSEIFDIASRLKSEPGLLPQFQEIFPGSSGGGVWYKKGHRGVFAFFAYNKSSVLLSEVQASGVKGTFMEGTYVSYVDLDNLRDSFPEISEIPSGSLFSSPDVRAVQSWATELSKNIGNNQ